jgi:hypothetical protein
MTSDPLILRFDEIPSLEGRSFTGTPFSLTSPDLELFERATWLDRAYPDPDPPEYPDGLVEGFMSLSLLDALAMDTVRFDPDTTYGLNYGLDRVRFAAQLTLGQRIVPRFDVTEVRKKGEGWLILRHCTLTAEGSDRPGVIADWWILILPRDQPQP